MVYDKVVDSAALDAAMTYTANRIRNKTGGTDQIAWDSAKGFGDAVDTITSGSSAPESDPREVYGGTRPAEWLRLPDYDKVEQNTMYLLVELKENYPNFESFTFRAKTATVDEGIVVNGAFVSKASRTIAGNGVNDSAYIRLDYDFNGFDWAKSLSNGNKQIVVRITLDTPYRNIQFNDRYSYYSPSTIRDVIYNITSSITFSADQYIYGIKYMYLKSGYPAVNRMFGLEGLGVDESNTDAGSGWGILNTAPEIRRLVGCPKIKKVINSYLLEELVADVSQFTATNIGYAGGESFKSLRKVVFSGTENLTSFPANLNFNKSNLSAAAIAELVESLPDISTSTAKTISLKWTPAAAEGIPDATLTVATNKGWTVVTA